MCQRMSEQVTQIAERARKRPTALMGVHTRNLDPKKRLTVPSMWREALGGDYVYVMKDPNLHCLRLIPPRIMDARIEELERISLVDANANDQLEYIGANSDALEFDVQGRIRINDEMLAFAGLKGAVELRGGIRSATIRAVGAAQAAETDVAALRDAMVQMHF